MLSPRDVGWMVPILLVAALLRLDVVPTAAPVLALVALLNAGVCTVGLLGALVRLGGERR